MRWSRRQTNTPLDELMTTEPDSTSTSTELLLRPGDHTGGSTTPNQAATERTPALEESNSVEDGPGADDSFLDDEDYLPQERRGPGRLTIALVAALVLAVGVLGGVWVEKQLGPSRSFGAAGGQGMPGGAAGGQRMPGGTAGGQGMPGGTSSGAAGGTGVPGGSASGAADGSSSAGAPQQTPGTGGPATAPVVVGVISSVRTTSLVVNDLGGTKHTVTITKATTVTAPYGHGEPKTGDTVAISGGTNADGVVATSLTIS